MISSNAFSGHDIRILQAALPEFAKQQKNLDDYTVTITRFDDRVTVDFMTKDRNPKAKGGHGFEVELDKDTLQVTKSHFVR